MFDLYYSIEFINRNDFIIAANRSNANNVWNVNTSGNVNNDNAYNGNSCCPDYVNLYFL